MARIDSERRNASDRRASRLARWSGAERRRRRADRRASVRFHRAENRLFSSIERIKALAVEHSDDAASIRRAMESDLVPAMRAAAAVHVRSGARVNRIDVEEVLSHLDERIVHMLESIDLELDSAQILAWVYQNFRHGVTDAKRAMDPLSRRERSMVKQHEQRVEVIEAKRHAVLSDREQHDLAKTSASSRAIDDAFAAIVTNGLHHVSFEPELHSDASSEISIEAMVEAQERIQALHLTGAAILDDDLYEAFIEILESGRIAKSTTTARVLRHLQQEILGAPRRSSASAAVIERDRYYEFTLYRFTTQDRESLTSVIERFGLRCRVRQHSDRVELLIAESAAARRAGAMRAILEAAAGDGWRIGATPLGKVRLPHQLSMRVIPSARYDTSAYEGHSNRVARSDA